jgi:hypothetical protein
MEDEIEGGRGERRCEKRENPGGCEGMWREVKENWEGWREGGGVERKDGQGGEKMEKKPAIRERRSKSYSEVKMKKMKEKIQWGKREKKKRQQRGEKKIVKLKRQFLEEKRK